jgi:eukaryotic translation initiation factor 2C
VNHFIIKFGESSIFQYDIKVDQDLGKLNQDSSGASGMQLSNADLKFAKSQLFQILKQPPHSLAVAYDGKGNLFTFAKLPEISYKVKVGPQTYNASAEFKQELPLSQIDQQPLVLRKVLPGLDAIVREASSLDKIIIGPRFYMPDQSVASQTRRFDLTTYSLKGTKQTLKPTKQGLILCVDYSAMEFCQPGTTVLDLVNHLANRGHRKSPEDLSEMEWKYLEGQLKGLCITLSYETSSAGRKYKVQGLTDKRAEQITFSDFDESSKTWELVEYYHQIHEKVIKRKLPCLVLNKNPGRPNYVPIELCILHGWQKYPKDPNQKPKGPVTSDERKEEILRMVEAGPCR